MNVCRVGIIGFGNWPRLAYAPVIKSMPDVHVAAVAARSEATRGLARDTFGDSLLTFENYHDLLADESIDAVMLALPNELHAAAIEAAARSGKHLFYEPPLANDEAAAQRVLAALGDCNQVVQADLELRCLPVIQAIMGHLDSGEMGGPLMARIRLWCDWGYQGGPWLDEVEGQSFFLWLGCWYFDVLDALFAASPTRVSVVGGHASNGRLMDHGWASLVYPGNRIGQFEFNLVAAQGAQIELLVACQKGEIHADLKTGAWRWRGASNDWKHASSPASEPMHGFEGMRESIGDFIRAIRTGVVPRANLEVMRRVQQAAQLCADAEPQPPASASGR